MTKQDHAVMQLSVYNALSLTGQDMTADEVVAFLAGHWDPTSSPNARRVSRVTVAKAADALAQTGHITRDGECLRIAARDPMTKRGQPLNIDYKRGALVRDNYGA